MTEHTTLRELFDAALEQPAGARTLFLDTHCRDPLLRKKIDKLLNADTCGNPDLEKGAAKIADVVIHQVTYPSPTPGTMIGPFELIAVLGEGGSSTVFRASRTLADVRQDVALKLLHRPLYSPEAQHQFRRERTALSQLRHAGIARLIEGGITETGFAYIALELVEGVPITEFARVHRLDLRARLDLFRRVCRAVEAAHRALIVHRDLKPSNVLVNDDGDVKLLDFGIAKLLDADDKTFTHLRAFTPAYAAPEQRDDGLITTATDVYALGILLGELITGDRLNDGTGRTPSGHISENHPPGVLPAPPQVTRRQIRGDLDNIVLKAIELDPERRYVSAGALADDIDRLLDGMPVAAHPPSTWYRTRKFVSRHRGGVVTTAAFLLAIFAALGIAVWQANVARHEALRANAVRDFLVQLFDAAKTDLPTNQKPTPEILVDEAVKRAQNDPAIAPELRADLLLTLGTVAQLMGDYPRAETLLGDAAKRQDQAGLPPASPERLDLAVQTAELMRITGRSTDADATLSAVLPQLHAQDSPSAVEGLMAYALTQEFAGKGDNAFAIAKEVSEKARRVYADGSLDAIKLATFPGQICVLLRRPNCAEMLTPAVARWRTLGVPLDIDYAQALDSLAVAQDRVGDFAAAEKTFREGIDLRRKIFAAHTNDRMAGALEAFSIFLTHHERFAEAQPPLDEAISIYRTVFGADNEKVASALDTLGVLQLSQRQFDVAEKSLRESLRLYEAHSADAGQQEDDPSFVRLHLAQTLIERGAFDEAHELLVAALAELHARHGAKYSVIASALALDARVALERGDTALAASTIATAIAMATDTPTSPRSEAAIRGIHARILAAQNHPDEAIAEINRTLDLTIKATPNAHAMQASLLALRARQETALNRSDESSSTIAKARALNVDPSLLSAQDALTINGGKR